MNAVEIPVELVTPLRAALITELAFLAGNLEQACSAHDKVKNAARFAAVWRELDACRSMLDTLGWYEPDDLSIEGPQAIDLTPVRRPILLKALETELVVAHDHLAELADIADAEDRCEQERRNIRAVEQFLNLHDPSKPLMRLQTLRAWLGLNRSAKSVGRFEPFAVSGGDEARPGRHRGDRTATGAAARRHTPKPLQAPGRKAARGCPERVVGLRVRARRGARRDAPR